MMPISENKGLNLVKLGFHELGLAKVDLCVYATSIA